MKAKESIDDSRESMNLSPAATEAVIQGAASTLENKRRRLVRGAVAAAPLVLTLRSGALAVASCTGARLVDIPGDGKFPSANLTDVCINQDPAPVCPEYPLQPGLTKVLTEPVPVLPVTPSDDGQYYCGTEGNHLSGKRVAILSSMSASSLTGGRIP